MFAVMRELMNAESDEQTCYEVDVVFSIGVTLTL